MYCNVYTISIRYAHMMSYHDYHASYVYDSFCTAHRSIQHLMTSTIVYHCLYTLYRSNPMPLPSPSMPSRMSLSPPVCMIQKMKIARTWETLLQRRTIARRYDARWFSLFYVSFCVVMTLVSNPRSGSHLTHQSNKKKSKKSNKKKSKKVRRSLVLSYLCLLLCC